MFLPDLLVQPFFLSSNILHLREGEKNMNEQSVQTKENVRKITLLSVSSTYCEHVHKLLLLSFRKVAFGTFQKAWRINSDSYLD